MTNSAQISVGNVGAQVTGVDENAMHALSTAMSYVVEGAEHMGSGWDGRTSMFDWATGKFPAGFQHTAVKVLRNRSIPIKLRRKALPAPLGPKPTPDNPLVDSFPNNPDYDYQFDTIDIMEKHGKAIIRVATGGGKSRIAKLCIKRIGRKTLFITTRQVLMYQMGDALEEAGFKISYVGDGQWDTSGDIVLGMVQTLTDRVNEPKINHITMSDEEIEAVMDRWRLRKDEALELLHSIEFVIGEEAHESGGQSYYTILQHCKNAAYRMALTATPLMRDGESNMRLVASFGPIRLTVTEEYLIDRGILATPKFKFIDIKAAPTLRRSTNWQKAEQLGIMEHELRNRYIVAETIRAKNWGMPAMILVKRQKHGKLLAQMLKRNGVNAVWIFGENSDQKKRKRVLKQLADGEIDAVIGSTIMDVGVDVPAISMLIIAGGGKAEVTHRQRVGRGLRRKVNVPNFCYVVDFIDRGSKHLVKHYKTRRAIIDTTPGFKENILAAKDDFDFAGDGWVRPRKAA